MDDSRIIELYFERNEQAIAETAEKYGGYCHTVAFNILADAHDSDECVNETYFRAWNKIPPTVPRVLSAFLARITRNLALDRVRMRGAQRRGAFESLDELEGMIGGGELAESLEAEEIGRVIGEFLRGENELLRKIFVRRYFHCEELSDIAARYRISVAKVKTLLFRARLRLRGHLEKAGIIV